MAQQIVSFLELKRNAQEAAEAGLTIDDCPEKFAHFVDEWKQEFKKAKFDITCTSNSTVMA